MGFDFHGVFPFINNDTGTRPFSFRAKNVLPGMLTWREWLRIESRFHICFDFHDLSPFLISETNARALRPFINNDTRYLAVFFPFEGSSTWESHAAGVVED
jgi:hypothetical protein